MLTIRPTQVETLAQTQLLDRTCQFLRRELGDHIQSIPEAALREDTARRLKLAQQCRVRTERGMVRFVCLSMIISDGFERRPEYQPLFQVPDSPPDTNLEVLFRELTKSFGA